MPVERLRSVLLLGATGLVGGELLSRLLADPGVGRVLVLARRPVDAPASVAVGDRGKLESKVVDFDALAVRPELFAVDQIFCALGTTIRRAGSQRRFREVDHDYVVQAATMGLRQGARHFLLVSALGANPDSRIFYNRVKGEVERDVCRLEYRSVTIVRPSLLLGERAEFRVGEEVAKRLAWMIPRRWAPVRAGDVAQVLVDAAAHDAAGTRVIESANIPRA